MKIFLKLNLIIASLFISLSGTAQQDKKVKFFKSEMITLVNGKVYKSTVIGKKCNLTIKYRQKKYFFECYDSFNSKSLFQTFEVVEVKDGQIFTNFLFDVSEIKSKYLVRDSIDTKKKIEFIEEVKLENGGTAHVIYRFSN